MMLQTAWHGEELVTLSSLRVLVQSGQRVNLALEVEDLDFVSLRFGGPTGLVNAVAHRLARLSQQIDGNATVKLATAGRIDLALYLRGAATADLFAALAEALAVFLSATKLSWRLHLG